MSTNQWFAVTNELVTRGPDDTWLALVVRNEDGQEMFYSSPTGYEHDTSPSNGKELMDVATAEVEAWATTAYPGATLLQHVTSLRLGSLYSPGELSLVSFSLTAHDTDVQYTAYMEEYEVDDARQFLLKWAKLVFPQATVSE